MGRQTGRAADDGGFGLDLSDTGPGLFGDGGGGLNLGGDAGDDPAADPIGEVQYPEPGRVDTDMAADLEAVRTAFQKRAQAEKERFQAATDSEYWFAVPFESRAQKEAFLRFMGWLQLGDKYLDGVRLAELVGCPLPDASVPYVTAKPDPKLTALSLPMG